MDRNDGLEARISKAEITIIITMGLGEVPPIIAKISLRNQTSHMGMIAQIMGDSLINTEISHLIQTMETDLGMDPTITRMGTGDQIQPFLVHHRLKEETSHRITPIANQEVINPITPRPVDLTINQRLVLRPTSKNFRRAIIRHPLMWFASPQPMILLMKYRIFVR